VGVSRDVMEHQLQVNPSAKPKKQKLQKMSNEKAEASRAEVQRLLDVGFIREVTYSQWLANVVMVRKRNGKWQMCTDFTNLNKCFPKDNFPLTRINKMVNFIAGCDMMVLLDYFSRYHQIWIRREDKEKTTFITPFDT
jgi:hypothetical protein